MTNLEETARILATRAHEGHVRKYTGQPYITHPEEVADIVRSVPHDEFMLAAAWLHDTVEDCNVTLEMVEVAFGIAVRDLVWWLTDVSKKTDGNRKTRKAIDRNHIAAAPASAQTVKLADLISNTQSIVQYDPDFARVYLREKADLLGVLIDGDVGLWRRAKDLCDSGIAALGIDAD